MIDFVYPLRESSKFFLFDTTLLLLTVGGAEACINVWHRVAVILEWSYLLGRSYFQTCPAFLQNLISSDWIYSLKNIFFHFHCSMIKASRYFIIVFAQSFLFDYHVVFVRLFAKTMQGKLLVNKISTQQIQKC